MRANAGLVLLQFSLALGVGSVVSAYVGDACSTCLLGASTLSFIVGCLLLRARHG